MSGKNTGTRTARPNGTSSKGDARSPPRRSNPRPLSASAGGTVVLADPDQPARRPIVIHPERRLFDPNRPGSAQQGPSDAHDIDGTAPAPKVVAIAARENGKTFEDLMNADAAASRTQKGGSARALNAFSGQSGRREAAANGSSSRANHVDDDRKLASREKSSSVEKEGKASKEGTLFLELDVDSMDLRDTKNVKILYKAVSKLEELVKSRNGETSLVVGDTKERMRLAALTLPLLLSHPTFSHTQNLESRLWKAAFLTRIEQFRRATSPDDAARASAVQFIDGAAAFYSAALDRMKTEWAGKGAPSMPRWARTVGYLGDLARYKVEILEVGGRRDWTEARGWYEMASLLAPDNGLYIYQLATIHGLEGRYLSAFEHFARCQLSRAPFSSAKDRMLLLFGSAKKSYEAKGRKHALELAFVRVLEILHTRISLDRIRLEMKPLREVLVGKNRPERPEGWHVQVTVLTMWVLAGVGPAELVPTGREAAGRDAAGEQAEAGDGPPEQPVSAPGTAHGLEDDRRLLDGEDVAAADREIRAHAAALAAAVLESVVEDAKWFAAPETESGGKGRRDRGRGNARSSFVESPALVAARVWMGWCRTRAGMAWISSSYFESHHSLWQALQRFSSQLHTACSPDDGATTEPDEATGDDSPEAAQPPAAVTDRPASPASQPDEPADAGRPRSGSSTSSSSTTSSARLARTGLFPEDWSLRGFLPVMELHDRVGFDAALGGRMADELFRERMRAWPACAGREEGGMRARALVWEVAEAVRVLPFMDVDPNTGEVFYVGQRKQKDEDYWRLAPAPAFGSSDTARVRRIDDDDDIPAVPSVAAVAPRPVATVAVDDESDEEVEFADLMGGGAPAQPEEEEEPSEEVIQLRNRKRELSELVTSRAGGEALVAAAAAVGDRGRRGRGGFGGPRHVSPAVVVLPPTLVGAQAAQTAAVGGKKVLALEKGMTPLVFDTNCYIGDLEGTREVVEAGWDVVVPLAIITELDGLSSAEGLLGEAAGLALSYLESLFQPGGGGARVGNVTLITAQNSVLPVLTIRTEEWGAGVRGADDVLVRCAKKRGAVLVSNDVNLRLKARGMGVVTGSMEEVFLAAVGKKARKRVV
ncbi:hypothetical protein HDU96_002674 [Phlyctochytrium bullatum]|nr:hypothetical protein HDU96_002674 [Phlyctochytrium bullatum]